MNRLNTVRKTVRILLFGLLGALTVVTGALNRLFAGDVYPYTSVDRAVGLEALERSQGVATDGSAWFFSGKHSLVKVAFDNQTVLALNRKAIPEALSAQYGSAHIGGISYANGLIYAAIEDSKVWENPIVALFDGKTLEYTGRYVRLPGKSNDSPLSLKHGVPWVSCDPENGLFYVGECRHTQALIAYDLDTFEYAKTIPLSGSVDRIQGGDVYRGVFYAATNDATRAVYSIDLSSGQVRKCFDRILYQPRWIDNFGGEGEDLTVLPMPDGTLLHTLTIGALFVDANLSHYTLPESR